MGLINWIFDFYQHSKIERLNDELADARLRSASGGIDAVRLEKVLGELALAVKAVQRLAVEKGLCTADELQRKLAEVDREDGRQDGRTPC